MADKPDAIALLKADHRKVEGLFEKFEKAKSDFVKKSLVQEICTTQHPYRHRGGDFLSRLHPQDRGRPGQGSLCRA